MKKKFICLALTLAMVMSMALPAFAGSVVSGDSTVSATSTLSGGLVSPTLTLTMPAANANKLILNPYKLAITAADGGSEDGDLAGAEDQVISAGLSIQNDSNTPVKVGLKAVATGASLKFETKACTGKELTKSVFAFVELQKGVAAGTSEAAVPTEWTDPADVNAKCYPQLVFVSGDTGVSNDAIATLPKKGEEPNWLYYKVGGNCAVDPTGGWVDTDTLSVVFTFTFTATVPKEIAFENATTMGELAELSDTAVAMNGIVRVEAKEGKTLTAVTAKDATGANVAVTAVTAGQLYFFKVPASDVTVTVAGS